MARKKKTDAVIDPNLPPPSFQQTQKALRRYVENFYDIQEMRLAAGGRVAKKPKKDKNGNPIPEIKLHELDLARLEGQAKALETAEDLALKDVEACLQRIPFYVEVLSNKSIYKGVGPTMAGVILSSFDIAKEDTVSKMWAFAGLRPMPCHRCKYCHAIVETSDEIVGESSQFKHPKIDKVKCVTKGRDYLNFSDVYASGKAQKPQAGVKLNFNKWLRTKLVGVLGPVILKMTTFHCPQCKEKVVNLKDAKGNATDEYAHPSKKDKETGKVIVSDCVRATVKLNKNELIREDAPFRKFYDNYKQRKEQAKWGMNDGHRHNAAIRYMIKMLLLDIYNKWRKFEGLPVRAPYQEEYLGHKHIDVNDLSQPLSGNQSTEASRGSSNNRSRNADHNVDDDQSGDVSPEFIEAQMDEEVALANR